MADKFSIEFDLGDFSKGLESIVKLADEAVDKRTADVIGQTIVNEMKNLISKGTSPIKGNKRFPAYLATKRGKDEKKRGYPYNKQSKYPSKGTRPVNLTLSGEFLSNLQHRSERKGKSYDVKVGFRDQESIDKELGHRTGANGQPKRPIIPTTDEEFAKVIQVQVERIFAGALNKFFKSRLR